MSNLSIVSRRQPLSPCCGSAMFDNTAFYRCACGRSWRPVSLSNPTQWEEVELAPATAGSQLPTACSGLDVLGWLLDQPCPACNKLSAWMTHTTSAISCTACGFLITLEHFQLILAGMMTGEARSRPAVGGEKTRG